MARCRAAPQGWGALAVTTRLLFGGLSRWMWMGKAMPVIPSCRTGPTRVLAMSALGAIPSGSEAGGLRAAPAAGRLKG